MSAAEGNSSGCFGVEAPAGIEPLPAGDGHFIRPSVSCVSKTGNAVRQLIPCIAGFANATR